MSAVEVNSQARVALMAGFFATSALLSSSAVAAQEPQDQSILPGGAAASYDEITLDLSILLKTRADEFFIQGSREEAKEKYKQASDELASIRTNMLAGPGAKAFLLLKADIEYRQILLSNNLSFWGGVRSLSPNLPGPLLNKLDSDTSDLLQSISEIYEISETQSAAELKAAEAASASMTASATSYTQKAKQEIELMQGREARLTRHETLARIASLQDQRKQLEAEMEKASSALRSAQDATNKAFLDAASAYAGLPPKLVDAAIEGNTRVLVTSLVLDTEFLASPELASAAQQLTSKGSELASAIKFYGDARSALADAETAKRMLSDPTPENLFKLGEAVWSRLPKEAQASIDRSVKEQAPVRALTSFLKEAESAVGEQRAQLEALHSALADALSKQQAIVGQLESITPSALTAMNKSEARLRKEVQSLYTDLAKEATLSDAAMKLSVDTYIRINSAQLVQLLPSDGRARLKTELGVSSDSALVQRLSEKGLSTSRDLRLAGGQLILLDGRKQYPLGEVKNFYSQLRSDGLKIPQNALNSHFVALISNLKSESSAARERILKAADPAQIDKVLGDWLSALPTVSRRSILEQTNKDLASKAGSYRNIANDLLAKSSLGQAAAQEMIGKIAPAVSIDDVIPRDSGPSADEAVARAVAMQALNAAFPGAGIAAQLAISVVENMSQMGKQIDNMQRFSNLSRQLMKEEAQLSLSINPALLQEALASKQYEIARIQQQAASEQARIFQQVHAAAGGQVKDAWTRIKIRRPLVFYRTEELRQTYDLLDASYSLWVGGEAGLNNRLDSMVRENPQNLRFALDSEIDLFGWLNRDLEGSRTDLDSLAQHWNQLRVLANNSVGPSIQNTPPVQLARTESFLIDDLLTPRDSTSYKLWLANPSQPLTVRFSMDPLQRRFQESMRNTRVVEVGLSAVSGGGGHSRIVGAMLKHPGTGLVEVGHLTEKSMPMRIEALLPQNYIPDSTAAQIADGVQPIPSPFRQSGARGTLEGYSPYTVWELRIDNTQRSLADVRGIALAFSYSGIPKGQILTEADFLSSLDRSQTAEEEREDFDWVTSRFPVEWRSYRARYEGARSIPLALSEREVVLLAPFDSRVAKAGSPEAKGGGVIKQCGTKAGAAVDGCPSVSLKVEAVCRAPTAIRAGLFEYYLSDVFWTSTSLTDMNPCPSDIGMDVVPPPGERRAMLAEKLAVCAYSRLEDAGLCKGGAQ
jgi:hypothetical protein